MAYDLQEQEQIAAFKAWWAKWGNAVTGFITAILLAFAGWNGWNWYERREAAQAVVVFEALEKAAVEQRLDDVKAQVGLLTGNHASTGYAARGALVAAFALVEAGRDAEARPWLQWVVDQSDEEGLVAVARLRLANLQIDEKAFDAALATLGASFPASFAGLVADRRGDIFLLQGKTDEARKAYTEALAAMTDAALKQTIQIKLDALGGA